ncbi:MAG: hypothetical protein AAF403_01420, partial [Pseudomonadota bacterium]
NMRKAYKHLAKINVPLKSDWTMTSLSLPIDNLDHKQPLKGRLNNFYMSDPITCNSPTMAQCSRFFIKQNGSNHLSHHHAESASNG